MKEGRKISGDEIEKTVVDFLNAVPLFGHLGEADFKKIFGYLEFYEVDEGKLLFREGDKGDFVCFVIDGLVDIVKESATGLSVKIATLSKGASVGEMSIIENTRRSATARVKEKAVLMTFTEENFNAVMENLPKIGNQILKGMARLLSSNLRRTSDRLVEYMFPLL